MVFLHACLTGITSASAYACLWAFRKILPHRMWAVNLEDGIFWAATSVYVFVQIYHTTSGKIRWYFVLGVVVGVLIMKKTALFVEKLLEKIYVLSAKKRGKTIDKFSQKR